MAECLETILASDNDWSINKDNLADQNDEVSSLD